MAALKIVSEQPERIELRKGSANSAANLIGLVIFATIACAGLSTLLGGEGEFNPVMIVVILVIGAAILNGFAQAARTTRVVLDRHLGTAARTDSLFFIPSRKTEIPLNLIREVQVSPAAGMSRRMAVPFSSWQVRLDASNGSTMVVNERGARAEMQWLGQKLGEWLNRPVREIGAATASTRERPAETTYAPSFSVSSTAMPRPRQSPDAPYAQASARQAAQQRAADAKVDAASARLRAEEVTAKASVMGTTAVMDMQQTAAGAPIMGMTAQLNAEQTAANASVMGMSAFLAVDQITAFQSDAAIQARMDAAQTLAGAPVLQSGAQLAAKQAAVSAENMLAAQPSAFHAPAVLVPSEMPAPAAFAPTMNLPSFLPFDSTLSPPMMVPTEAHEIKEVAIEVNADEASDAREQYRAARREHAQRNWKEALALYRRALGLNPADAALNNDLGVLFYEQNKLQDAERVWRRAVALDPFAAPSRYNLGWLLMRTNRRGEAYEQFKLGAQSANPTEAAIFENALHGDLRAPLPSPTP